MRITTPTSYGLQVLAALCSHPQGLSLKELQHFTPANNIPEAIRGLRVNHGFRHCLLTESIKRPGAPCFGRYHLTTEGMKKARLLLKGRAGA